MDSRPPARYVREARRSGPPGGHLYLLGSRSKKTTVLGYPRTLVFDSLCHLELIPEEHLEGILARAQQAGLLGMLVGGTDPDRWESQVELAKRNPQLHCAYGIHPHWAAELPASEQLSLDQLRKYCGSAVAIGEIGLDFQRAFAPDLTSKNNQLSWFRAQLALAIELNLPVILHIVRAHGPAIDLLRDSGIPSTGGMVHSFSGSIEILHSYLELGLAISFSGAICNPTAKKARAALLEVPRGKLLVETDSPFQTPLHRRPGTNEPSFLVDVVHQVADIRGVEPAQVAQSTTENAQCLFQIP